MGWVCQVNSRLSHRRLRYKFRIKQSQSCVGVPINIQRHRMLAVLWCQVLLLAEYQSYGSSASAILSRSHVLDCDCCVSECQSCTQQLQVPIQGKYIFSCFRNNYRPIRDVVPSPNRTVYYNIFIEQLYCRIIRPPLPQRKLTMNEIEVPCQIICYPVKL